MGGPTVVAAGRLFLITLLGTAVLYQDFDSAHFDEEALGWPYIEVDHGHAQAEDSERKFIYDTMQFAHANTGHTFGDHLTEAERRAVLEYLKTL